MATKKETVQLTDGEIDKLSEKIGEELKEQPKMKIKLPLDPRNKHINHVPVTINGWTTIIKLGEVVEVPEEIYNILVEAGYY